MLVEQDIVQALTASNRVYCLQEGRVALSGVPSSCRARRSLRPISGCSGWIGSTSSLQGILVGGLYAMFAAGLSLIFGVMRLVNIAHGDLIVLAAYLALVDDADARHRSAYCRC